MVLSIGSVNWSKPLTFTLLTFFVIVMLFAAPSTPKLLPTDIASTLTPLLSSSAVVLLPSSPEFSALLSRRWSTSPLNGPTPSAIVVPTSESDISQTIRFANAHDLPFLATSGGHGTSSWLSTLGRGGGGVLIHLKNLTKFELAEDGETVVLGGGSVGQRVMERLWEHGKQTTTGSCGCVSVTGPMLGGGHGLLQGQYGLLADQLVSARVVLADGEVVDVSERERPDLFWALRGAGHNFGVVSEFRYRIYDVPEERRSWVYQNFIFGGDRLEEYYELANRMMLDQPSHVVAWSFWIMDKRVDADKPVIIVSIHYSGSEKEAKEYAEPIRALGPISSEIGVRDYPELMEVMGLAIGSPICEPQGTVIVRGVDTDKYHIRDIREWYNVFSDMLASNEAFASSQCLLEGYSVHAVQAVPNESTAFALRDQNLLFGPVVIYKPTDNGTLDAEAERWSEAMEKAASGNQRRRTYVNYSHGDEGLQALYGYEPWRLEKLKKLKQKYDPENRFRFYAPIVPEQGQ
ncbi:6-hydroxy-D-nicotine oxidase [Madurella mycetomatis]|uniref:6-hydroxy-D-nicotine oxidase n=1 Tax=Madurella mycetomatis TaxID=100816 RepID=A0A175WHN9_9PEZI|nr:6-hydroxy-D-nicotine oxidase [Madurella mycetomatis]